jgi:hypothetical protein
MHSCFEQQKHSTETTRMIDSLESDDCKQETVPSIARQFGEGEMLGTRHCDSSQGDVLEHFCIDTMIIRHGHFSECFRVGGLC